MLTRITTYTAVLIVVVCLFYLPACDTSTTNNKATAKPDGKLNIRLALIDSTGKSMWDSLITSELHALDTLRFNSVFPMSVMNDSGRGGSSPCTPSIAIWKTDVKVDDDDNKKKDDDK